MLCLSAGGMLCRFSSSGCRHYCNLKGHHGGQCEKGGGCQCSGDQSIIQSMLKTFSSDNPDYQILEDILNAIKEHEEDNKYKKSSDGKYR